jgi:hypothetical protein
MNRLIPDITVENGKISEVTTEASGSVHAVKIALSRALEKAIP